MDEFIQEIFEDSIMLYGEAANKLVQSGDKFSENASANITIFLKDVHKLVNGLVNDIETGKIGKTPRRLNTWQKKRQKRLAPEGQEVVKEKKKKKVENVQVNEE